MSIALSGKGDYLVANDTLSIGTGDFSVGVWVKMSDNGSITGNVIALSTAAPLFTSGTYLQVYQTTSDTLWVYSTNSGSLGTAFSVSSDYGNWVYIVLSRSGTTLDLRVFDDSTSTTPIHSLTDTESMSLNVSYVTFGSAFDDGGSGEIAAGSYRSGKVHVGYAWSNTEARAESQDVNTVSGSGTWWGAWDLLTTDSGYLADLTGNARTIANTGGVTDSGAEPTQLPAGESVTPTTASMSVTGYAPTVSFTQDQQPPLYTWAIFPSAIGYLDDSTIQIGAHAFRARALSSAYTFWKGHTVLADLTGQLGTDQLLSLSQSGNMVSLAADATWTDVDPNAVKYIAIYDDTPTSPADPLLVIVDMSSAQTIPAGANFRLRAGDVYWR